MKSSKLLLLSVIVALAGGARSARAQDKDDEILCKDQPGFTMVGADRQAVMEAQFRDYAASLMKSTAQDFSDDVCSPLMADFDDIKDALNRGYRVDFINERPWLCAADGTRRQVDAVNHAGPGTSYVYANGDAWEHGLPEDRLALTAHELLGAADRRNEQWTMSFCWSIGPLFHGAVSRHPRSGPPFYGPMPLLAGGPGGGGASGGHGGGDMSAAGVKLRAFKILLWFDDGVMGFGDRPPCGVPTFEIGIPLLAQLTLDAPDGRAVFVKGEPPKPVETATAEELLIWLSEAISGKPISPENRKCLAEKMPEGLRTPLLIQPH